VTSATLLPESPAADLRVSGWLMTATYVIGAVGYSRLGFFAVATPPAIGAGPF